MSMAFVLRSHHRFPVFGPIRYETRNRDGYGSVTNVSSIGWRLSGSLPVYVGDICSFKVNLPTLQVSVAGKVRWVRGQEFGLETLVMDGTAQAQLGEYVQERIKEL